MAKLYEDRLRTIISERIRKKWESSIEGIKKISPQKFDGIKAIDIMK
jgi:hypothetical protein